jgi:hypothetical protein
MSKKTKKSFTQFVTRPKANLGFKVAIPDTDGETITVLGVDSDKFKQTNHAIFTELSKGEMSETKPTKEEIEKKAHANKIRLLSALVTDWSFSEKCTPEKVAEFLNEAPYVADLINDEADKISNYMGKL